MAELAVSGALALMELAIFLIDRHNFRKVGVKDEIINMKDWLTSTKAFIQTNDACEQQATTVLDDHLKQVRDIAYDIEDVIDQFLLHLPLYLFHNHQITKWVHTSAHQIWHGLPLKRISDRIFAIEKRITQLKSQREAFPSASTRPTTSESWASPLLRDHEMVGYEIPKRDFISSLLDGEGKELLRLAVVGPSGSGKTSFVKNVFWRAEIRKQFDCRAWVHVGRNSDTGNLITNLLKQLKIDAMDEGGQAKLQNYLARNRYMIVLDDVYDNIDLSTIKNSFPGGSLGSRLIVTTKFSNVASWIGSAEQYVFKLEGLEWLHAWKLFCRIAFERNNGECPSELKESAVKIAKRCERLPRNLVVMGGALARKDLPCDWDRFHDNLGSGSLKDSEVKNIYNALLPDYMDLSSNCKSCFLYFSMFPEDYSVRRGRLIRLWVAEGFAQKTPTKTAEDVAGEYLDELIRKNLVQVSKWDIDGRRPSNCRVLNLVLKFIVEKCEHENFASVFNREHTSCNEKIRRLSVHHDCSHLPQNNDFRGIRSMFLLRLLGTSPSDFNDHLKKMKLLKVLDFQFASITQFPKAITDLTLMKYLSFRGTKIMTIPSSIEKLSYLETLDLKQTDVTELPKEISHLHNLCHLFVYKYNVHNYVVFDSVQGVKIPCSIGKMTNLQDLSVVKVGKNGTILKDLKNLRQLRKLGLVGIKEEHSSDLCAVINGNPVLRTLDLCTSTQQDYLELGMVNEPPQSLRRLYLKGLMRELPAWISSLNSMMKVALKWSHLKCSPVTVLQCLPNLLELQLIDCYTGEELMFQVPGFKKLQVLVIEDLMQLNTVVIEDGVMPNLKQLSLRKCPRLEMFPLGMEMLEQLEEVTLFDMPKELVARIGEYLEETEHKPTIECFRLNAESGSFERSKCF